MRNNPKTWGGGPEIIALSNLFRCPIHVYELCTVNVQDLPNGRRGKGLRSDANPNPNPNPNPKGLSSDVANKNKKLEFSVRPKALFGSPDFDNKSPLFILSADGRFPTSVEPGNQLEEGDHFLAMYPCHFESMGGIDDRVRLLFESVIEPIQKIFSTITKKYVHKGEGNAW